MLSEVDFAVESDAENTLADPDTANTMTTNDEEPEASEDKDESEESENESEHSEYKDEKGAELSREAAEIHNEAAELRKEAVELTKKGSWLSKEAADQASHDRTRALTEEVAQSTEPAKTGSQEKGKGYRGVNKEPHQSMKALEKKFGAVALISHDSVKGITDIGLNQLYEDTKVAKVLQENSGIAGFLFGMFFTDRWVALGKKLSALFNDPNAVRAMTQVAEKTVTPAHEPEKITE